MNLTSTTIMANKSKVPSSTIKIRNKLQIQWENKEGNKKEKKSKKKEDKKENKNRKKKENIQTEGIKKVKE